MVDHVTWASSATPDIAKLLSNFRSHSALPIHLMFMKLLITGSLVDLEWNGTVLTCISSIVMWLSKCSSVYCQSGFLLCKWSVHMFSIIYFFCYIFLPTIQMLICYDIHTYTWSYISLFLSFDYGFLSHIKAYIYLPLYILIAVKCIFFKIFWISVILKYFFLIPLA